jgi:uncharacterized protein YeaO (DUF488 family)
MIHVKRVRDNPEPGDGRRFLVDRHWPRGMKKDSLHVEAWLKDVAPSDELRRWFGHDSDRWDEFRRRYFAELDAKPETWRLIAQAARRGKVTLVFGAKDTEHNNAIALKEYLVSKGSSRS